MVTTMVRPDLPPPANACGSFESFLDKAKGTRRVSTLFGEENKEGNRFADLPGWFTRTGLRSFEIDSGFGVVKCCAPDHKAQKQMEAADEAVNAAREAPENTPNREAAIAAAESKRDDTRVVFALRMIRELPKGWTNEGDAVKEGTLSVAPGAPIPAPSDVAAMSLDAQRAYVAFLPPSLLGQVWAGYGLMALPPLYYDEKRTVNPS